MKLNDADDITLPNPPPLMQKTAGWIVGIGLVALALQWSQSQIVD